MKILCAEFNAEGKTAVVTVGDDALLRNNEDFYIPEFAGCVSCVPQFVVRICKLGKSVGERFAHRYFEEVGAGIRFYADDYERELQEAGLPATGASAFDGSAAIGRLVGKEECGRADYAFQVNEKLVYGERLADFGRIERLIALASDFHTLKIGDYLYCGSSFRCRVREGDRLRLCFQGKEWMNFKLK